MDSIFNIEILYKDGQMLLILSVYNYKEDPKLRFLTVNFNQDGKDEIFKINLDDVRSYRICQFHKLEEGNELD